MKYTLKRTKKSRSMAIWWPWKKIPTVYISIRRGNPGDTEYERTLVHELVHVKQWYDLGKFEFLLKYLTRKGRLNLEAEAFATNVVSWWKQSIYTLNVQYSPELSVESVPVLKYYSLTLKNYYSLWFIKESDIRVVLNGYSEELFKS